MQTYKFTKLSSEKIELLTKRAGCDQAKALEIAKEIFAQVDKNSDQALFELTKKFDKAKLKTLLVGEKEFEIAEKEVATKTKKAIRIALKNIRKFHANQNRTEKPVKVMRGVKCWRVTRPIEKVGLYIPGGTAPLPSTVLMLGVPANLAGCQEIILCTPPSPTGKIASEILYAAKQVGVDKIYKVGGAQAIAAMALGTKSVPKVDKIFGPGNSFVTAAKTLVSQLATGVAIDMPAGPSEILVVADKTANPKFVASDLLSQAEHGKDSQAVLVTNSARFAQAVEREIQTQMQTFSRGNFIKKSLEQSFVLMVKNISQAIDFTNLYAPEHLILSVQNPLKFLPQIQNAGSVFLGNYTPESFGDYASGTNHVLPTYGYARSYSGVSLDSFTRQMTCQMVSREGFKTLAPTVKILAEAETLEAHKNAVMVRE